jgi:hypothetical protein
LKKEEPVKGKWAIALKTRKRNLADCIFCVGYLAKFSREVYTDRRAFLG